MNIMCIMLDKIEISSFFGICTYSREEMRVCNETICRQYCITKLWNGTKTPSEDPYIGCTLLELEVSKKGGQNGTIFAE